MLQAHCLQSFAKQPIRVKDSSAVLNALILLVDRQSMSSSLFPYCLCSLLIAAFWQAKIGQRPSNSYNPDPIGLEFWAQRALKF